EHDAWFGQGYAAAQDRLWQMEYDRRRACGRWAEAAGAVAVPGDRLARRLQLARAAQADLGVMSAETRAMFEAYAAGVNAFLSSGQPLPAEYAITGINPEPWQPWHSVALFKIRHVLMGVWQQKLTQARLLALIGPEAYARLDGQPPAGSPVILPPSGAVRRLFEQAADDLRESAEQLGFLAEVEAGSNSWAVHGSRTTTGKPITCNDSHRALDVPTVYWQAHVACPEFDVIGGTFPGLPGFPHFGHNGSVAWNITHTGADYQDLYIEEFDRQNPGRCRTAEGWAEAERSEETISVRDGEPVRIELWRTRHGPVVHGDPRGGHAISLRYTATEGPCRGFEPLRPMLRARTVAELHEAQREWVDPVNNLVSADTSGNIGYLTRGYLPIRSSQAHRQLPAPGWSGEHEWNGRVPFEQLPQAINPEEGFIATANQKVIPGDEPYIAHQFAVPSRCERIRELLAQATKLSPDQIAAIQGDRVSVVARRWASLCRRLGPFAGAAEQARQMLAGWDADLLPESGAALLYACVRRELARALFEPVVGSEAWAWLASGDLPPLGRMIHGWFANVTWSLDGNGAAAAPDGRSWSTLMPAVLEAGWQAAARWGGADPMAWRWDALHRTHARHPLAAGFPALGDRLSPRRVAAGGDSDTIQCTASGWNPQAPFDISALSVYRQVADMADLEHASFVVPGGVSGLPGTEHAEDQLEHWRTHRRIPANFGEANVAAAAAHTLVLQPA
ncbi:MAG TPA: penicillin acylase family protein, partial [Dehalococcoidia bacterium]|nr:penicillin acylase family protein [Dehalococcoidia bacterium]